ncbi:OmpA family protein [Nocardiopsis suaedae]|uniref:OmpA family protein n=1 Tax=Nocardiopsis suaedae TaxID=3018444 RepID=A0ABT4TFT9_9ACTN|nr:OmpA family protein [Nocardiopsis suaedae]MDA2803549.1 OmpA family protein [Nocardiopsis suaedae]
MLNRRALRMIGTVGVVALLGAGCTGSTGQDDPEEPPADPQPAVVEPEGPFQRSGVFGLGTQFRAQLEIYEVERREDRTVLRFATTPLQDGEHNAKGGFGGGFRLVDPVGGRLYEQLPNPAWEEGDTADPDADPDDYVPENLGNDLPDTVMGDAVYVMEAHFPPVAEEVEDVTVVTPGTAGEFTGIPVTSPEEEDGQGEEEEEEGAEEGGEEGDEEEEGVRPGDVVELPTVDSPLPDDMGDHVENLYSVTEQGGVTTHTGRTAERVTLRTDGMFSEASGDGEDDAEEPAGQELTAEGRQALEGVAEDLAERIDPEEPEVSIGVHSDGDGKDEDNARETAERADAASAYLTEALGEDVSVSAEGHGSDRPVVHEEGDGKPEARAQNSRIEISYKVPPPPAGDAAAEEGEDGEGGGSDDGSGTGEDPSADESTPPPGPGEDGEEAEGGGQEDGAWGPTEPAPYRAQDPDVIADVTATVDGQDYRLQVMPFYRDGNYMVANFLVFNKSPELLSEDEKPFGSDLLPGSVFGSFSAVDPESGRTYSTVRIGGGDTVSDKRKGRRYLDPVSYPYAVRTNEENRTWLYLPAPPEGVGSVTFNAGAFGAIEDVPIE